MLRSASRFHPQNESSHPSFRSQGRPSLWRPWTGRRCRLNRRSESPVCGCAVFLLLTGVSAGGGGSATASWNCENETFFLLCCCCLHWLSLWLWMKKMRTCSPPVDVDFAGWKWDWWCWCHFKADFLFVKIIFLYQFFCFLLGFKKKILP